MAEAMIPEPSTLTFVKFVLLLPFYAPFPREVTTQQRRR